MAGFIIPARYRGARLDPTFWRVASGYAAPIRPTTLLVTKLQLRDLRDEALLRVPMIRWPDFALIAPVDDLFVKRSFISRVTKLELRHEIDARTVILGWAPGCRLVRS